MYRDDPDAFAKAVLDRVEAVEREKQGSCYHCADSRHGTWRFVVGCVLAATLVAIVAGTVLAAKVLVPPPSREERCRSACGNLRVASVTDERCECVVSDLDAR